jgi:hypothetical protein
VEDRLRVCFSVTYVRSRDRPTRKIASSERSSNSSSSSHHSKKKRRRRRRKYGSSANVVVVVVMDVAWSFDKEVRNELDNTAHADSARGKAYLARIVLVVVRGAYCTILMIRSLPPHSLRRS